MGNWLRFLRNEWGHWDRVAWAARTTVAQHIANVLPDDVLIWATIRALGYSAVESGATVNEALGAISASLPEKQAFVVVAVYGGSVLPPGAPEQIERALPMLRVELR